MLNFGGGHHLFPDVEDVIHSDARGDTVRESRETRSWKGTHFFENFIFQPLIFEELCFFSVGE